MSNVLCICEIWDWVEHGFWEKSVLDIPEINLEGFQVQAIHVRSFMFVGPAIQRGSMCCAKRILTSMIY